MATSFIDDYYYAFQGVSTTVFEADARSGHQVSDHPRHEHLAGPRLRGDAGHNVHRDAGDVISYQVAFAGMKAGADLDTQRSRSRGDRLSTTDGSARRRRWS
jgi:hypothetical protein